MVYDGDRDIIYKRIETVQENYSYRSWTSFNGIDIYPVGIGFCGEVYCGVQIRYRVKAYPECNLIKYYCYDKQKVLELINSDCKDIVNTTYVYKKNDKYHRKDTVKKINEAFDRVYMPNVFTEYNCPIFVVKAVNNRKDRDKMLINTNIGIYEFHKVFDPYTAYQKLKTYIEGIAQPLRPIPELSDEVMQEIKGFDHPYSFRKEPKNRY